MLSRRSTRGEASLGVAGALALAFVLSAAGCGRNARPVQPVSPPAPDSRLLEGTHPYERMRVPALSSPLTEYEEAGVRTSSSMAPADRAGMPDIRAVEKGLRGRADAMLQRYGENVLRREMDSARLAARVKRAEAEPDLERQIEQTRQESTERAAAIRREAGPERNALQLRLAALDSRIRASLWEVPSGLTEEREQVAVRIRELETGTESRVRALETETEERITRMRAAFEERMARLEQEEMQSARKRAADQLQSKQQEAEAALQEVLAQLRTAGSAPAAGYGLPALRKKSSPPAAPDFRGPRAAAQRKMREDARLAAELARETAEPGSGAARVRNRAALLLGGKP